MTMRNPDKMDAAIDALEAELAKLKKMVKKLGKRQASGSASGSAQVKTTMLVRGKKVTRMVAPGALDEDQQRGTSSKAKALRSRHR
jgi:hypothetical protein